MSLPVSHSRVKRSLLSCIGLTYSLDGAPLTRGAYTWGAHVVATLKPGYLVVLNVEQIEQ